MPVAKDESTNGVLYLWKQKQTRYGDKDKPHKTLKLDVNLKETIYTMGIIDIKNLTTRTTITQSENLADKRQHFI